MIGKSIMGIIVLLAMACASPEQKVSSSSTGLRKVMITSQADLEKIRGLGLDIIVEEKNYVIVRQDSLHVRSLADASIASAPVQETDMVQRMVKVSFASREQRQRIIDLGMDVWEVASDSLTARAYDYHLARLQADSVGYRVVEQYAGRKEEGK